ncbi:hypothetical protein BT69DRAFT_1335989 [Atractiella rhizophila]|nr:hypothetical protein BT69DRAFT_1335989 [Atractiella rhizophila]
MNSIRPITILVAPFSARFNQGTKKHQDESSAAQPPPSRSPSSSSRQLPPSAPLAVLLPPPLPPILPSNHHHPPVPTLPPILYTPRTLTNRPNNTSHTPSAVTVDRRRSDADKDGEEGSGLPTVEGEEEEEAWVLEPDQDEGGEEDVGEEEGEGEEVSCSLDFFSVRDDVR